MHDSIQNIISRPKYVGYYSLLFLLPFVVMVLLKDQKNTAILFLLSFLLFVLGFVFFKSKHFSDAWEWNKVKATILTINIVKMDCWSMFRRATLEQNTYSLKINYKYICEGEEYISGKYALSYLSDADCNYMYSLDEARRKFSSLKIGENIDIFVNPTNFSDSVIKRGRSEKYGLPYGQLFIVFFTYLFWLFLVI